MGSTANVMVGAAAVSVGAWVADAGASSLTDVGHTKGPCEFSPEFEDFDVNAETAYGTLKKVPQSAKFTLKIPMLETTADNMLTAFRQGSGQKSGATPDFTVAIADPKEQYHRIALVVPGPGTTKVRTLTFWKCVVTSVEPVAFAKGDSAAYNVTFDVLYDDSITTPATNGYFFKQVDA